MPNISEHADVNLKATRALSRALYGGAQYRVEIGAAIAALQLVNTTELADELGLTRQSVNQELRLLERIGLLSRMDQGSDRKVYFLPQPATYWRWCTEAMAEAPTMLAREPW